MPTIHCGDIDLHVTDVGSGPPVLLVHGFPLDHTMWRGQIDALSRHHRVIAPDLRGFGRSGVAPGTAGMEQFADDLAALLDALGVTQPVTFCGLSMGGYIAWQFQRKYAARLRALVLCDTKAAADSPEAARARGQTAAKVLAEGSAVLVDAMLPKLIGKATAERAPEVVDALRQMILSAPPEGVAAALRGMAQRPDVTADLPNIRTPALVIVGAEDAISPPAEMRAIAAALPDAEFVEVAGTGHMAPLEDPATVNAALLKFLAK